MELIRWCLALVMVVLLVVGCSTTQFNVPAVSPDGDGTRLPGKVVWHDLLTDTPVQTQLFYQGLFGWEFEPLNAGGANYVLIRHQGKLIGGMVDQNHLPTSADISQWVIVVSVTDVERATAKVRGAGGTVYTPPTSLGDRGEIAVVADAEGALFALLQTRDGDPQDQDTVPAQGEFLWDELWADTLDEAAAFYSSMAPYGLLSKELGGPENSVDYRVLSTQGRPRAGIRPNPVEGLPPMWVSYLRIADAEALDALLAKVESLGGEILVPAISRPRGGKVALIAGPSGAGIALQTWSNERTPGSFMEGG